MIVTGVIITKIHLLSAMDHLTVGPLGKVGDDGLCEIDYGPFKNLLKLKSSPLIFLEKMTNGILRVLIQTGRTRVK